MDTSEIKTIKIKLLKATTAEQENLAINSKLELHIAINNILSSNISSEIYYNELESNSIKMIEDEFQATVRTSVTDGCYGSSSGKQSEGYTLYLPLDLAQEHFSYEYSEYIINPIHEIENMGGEFLDYTEDQVEAYLDITEDSGIKVHHDNTYNHETEGCTLMCDMDIKMIGDLDDDNNGMLAVRFHCGGDIRGNYTRWYLVKFDSQYDVYSAILPQREIDQEVIEKCELINNDPADKELLIQELNELVG